MHKYITLVVLQNFWLNLDCSVSSEYWRLSLFNIVGVRYPNPWKVFTCFVVWINKPGWKNNRSLGNTLALTKKDFKRVTLRSLAWFQVFFVWKLTISSEIERLLKQFPKWDIVEMVALLLPNFLDKAGQFQNDAFFASDLKYCVK